MNVQSIWAGEEYAFAHYRPNKRFVMNAYRGRAKRVEKQKEWGNERATAYVIMDRLDVETGEVTRTDERVRARDVIDFWDSYENERKAIEEEREERYRKQQEELERMRAEREARLREQQELQAAKQRAENEQNERLVATLVEKTGLPRDCVYSVGPASIQLDRSIVEVWLSVQTS